MTNEKSSLKNQRDAYFQALENDEKMKKNKRKHGTTNTKSEQMERKKQLDSKRKLALEKLQKKNKSVIITKHSQQQDATENEKEEKKKETTTANNTNLYLAVLPKLLLRKYTRSAYLRTKGIGPCKLETTAEPLARLK